MDINDTIAAKSDQLDAVDLVDGERIFTVKRVNVTGGEQPVTVYLEEFDRPWRPGKNMRRVLHQVWGERSAEYVGRRVALFCDKDVVYAGKPVGGIRIRAMSHIDGPKDALIIPTQGRSELYRVQPLKDAPAPARVELSLPDRIEAAVAAYAEAGVTVPMLEAKVALPRDEWAEQTVADLGALFARLKARETTKDAEFDLTIGGTTQREEAS